MNKTIDELFGEITIHPPEEKKIALWTVEREGQPIAWFIDETDAFKFRKDKINRLLRR